MTQCGLDWKYKGKNEERDSVTLEAIPQPFAKGFRHQMAQADMPNIAARIGNIAAKRMLRIGNWE
jgi:hypothetical protein